MRDEPNAGLRRRSARSRGRREGRRSIRTAGRWSWKSKPAKECVTTRLPNGPAPKMDGARARRPRPALGGRSRPRGVGRRGGRRETSRATSGGAAPGADLGGSSDRSDENSEGRSGEGFRANGVRTRVSRPRGKGRFRKGRRRDRPRGPREGPPGAPRSRPPPKGNRVDIPGPGRGRIERRRERTRGRRRGFRRGFSALFDGQRLAPEIGSAGDGAGRPAERLGLRDVRSAPAGP